MADKKAPVGEEKVFNIPLRRKWTPVTRITKTKKSVSAVKEYIARHSHATDIKISEKLNDTLWASGAKNPLKSVTVKVNVVEGVASARLPEEITLEEEKKKFRDKKDEKLEEEKKKFHEKNDEKPVETKTIEKTDETEDQEKKDQPKAEEKKPEEKPKEEPEKK